MRVERDDLDACDPHLKFNILAVCRLRVQIQKNSKGFTLKFALVHFFKGGQTASELAKASELLQHATDLRPVKDKPLFIRTHLYMQMLYETIKYNLATCGGGHA